MIGKMSYWDFTGNDRKGFYILFYLNPGSCHRIHSPITGSITSFGFSPGTLYPVNTMGRKLVPDCHVKNAKVTLKLASPGDHVNIFLVLIGALAVGDITLTYNGRRVFNSRDRESLEIHAPAVPIKKGQEIGIFNLGSSVFMICYGRSGTGMNLIAREGDVSIGSGVIESEILKQEGGNG
jgi:phosphatidylserine decarboxylase